MSLDLEKGLSPLGELKLMTAANMILNSYKKFQEESGLPFEHELIKGPITGVMDLLNALGYKQEDVDRYRLRSD
jgi:hypothetical protein